MQEMLLKLATHLQALKFASHYFHNICSKVAFFSDHEFFGEVYGAADGAYDSVIERYVGLFGAGNLNLNALVQMSHDKIKSVPSQFPENHAMFGVLLQMENELNAMCNAICKSPECSEGTRQLVGDLANASEMRLYKIKRRMIK